MLDMKRLLMLTLCLAGCSHKSASPPPPSFPVHLTTVETVDVPIYLEGLGHVDPIIRVALRSRIEGNLTGVFFKQGQEVKEGDLLFTIDPKPYEAALKQARGHLDQNTANLSLAQEKVKRYQSLVQEEFFSQIDYETLQASYAANVALVTQAEAEVDSSLINLDYCWIYAPINGLMSILDVDFGNLVGNDQTQQLATINQISPIYVTFSLPEVQLPDIQKYQRKGCLKTLAAYENFHDEMFEGRLEIVNNEVDPGTGMIKLRAVFENEQRELWPGQFVRIRLVLYTQKDALRIPFTAIQMTASGPVAFVAKSNMTVERRQLKLGQRQGEKAIVLEGLKAGETVVLEGQLNLTPGAHIYIPAKT
jgi:multidrug efflux system membrane fusion protein